MKVNSKKIHDSKKFIDLKLFKNSSKSNTFLKTYLLYGMTYNTIFFCSKYRDLSYFSNFIKPIILNLNHNLNFFRKSTTEFFSKFFFSNWLKRNIFFSNFGRFIQNLFFSLKTNIQSLEKFLMFWNKKKKLIPLKNDFKSLNARITKKSKNLDTIPEKKNKVKAFLFAWATWNNFFASVIDNTGNTLISRTGGNSERTGSRQRATVFSADSAMYEVCFLARERGVESLSIHIKSTLRLPQIKNSFDGLEASGLSIDEVIYRPLKSFGGCRNKKPRWV